MAELFVVDRQDQEKQVLIHQSKDAVAILSNDRVHVSDYPELKEAKAYLEKDPTIDLAMFEVENDADIKAIEAMRSSYADTDVMLVASGKLSPMKYMTPRIRAVSLLLRPFSSQQSQATVHEFIDQYYAKNQVEDERSMVIENREGKTVIPFSQIYYIEVREKKVYIRLKDTEYSKYDSLDNLMKSLPDEFMRCHRSFVFNTRHFVNVKLSENTIYLDHDIAVPLSRYYKKEIKEYINGLRTV